MVAIMAGIFTNIITQGIINENINSFGDFVLTSIIGAATGAAGYTAGGITAGAIKYGGFIGGGISGTAGGAAGGFIVSAGNAWAGGANFGDGLKEGLIGGGIGALTGGLVGGFAGGIDAVKDGRRFIDGATVQDNILIDQNLPYVAQQGDYNCGPACGESASRGSVTQQQLRNTLGGNPNIDPIGDAYVWQEWSKSTGRPFNWVKGGMSTQDVLTNMRGGCNVAISLRGEVAHSVLANRVTERTITKISGKAVTKLLLDVMNPAHGQYYRLSGSSVLNARNIFLLFP